MDNKTVELAEIYVTQNGYMLNCVDRSDPLHRGQFQRRMSWTFETLAALVKELPRIMAEPYEKTSNTKFKKESV